MKALIYRAYDPYTLKEGNKKYQIDFDNVINLPFIQGFSERVKRELQN